MAFCPHCGAAVPDDAVFCPNCGKQLGAVTTGVSGAPDGPPAVPVNAAYPARLEIDYPDRPLDRVSTFFRIFAAIPILILVALVEGITFTNGPEGGGTTTAAIAGVVVLPVVLMLLFRRKYPGWWFDWNLELTRFTTRIGAYLALLDDSYPSTDEAQSVHLDIDRPDGSRLSRWMPLIKWLLAIPHLVILLVLGIGAFFVVVLAWFAILFTGRYPRWAFDYVVGVFRWSLRVQAYAVLLTTDEYPPFSLEP
jgi:hypothetical protein